MTPTERAVQALAAETEAWCRKAFAKGQGWRVWRSESRHEQDSNFPALCRSYRKSLAAGETL
jgi:hypothetical protein